VFYLSSLLSLLNCVKLGEGGGGREGEYRLCAFYISSFRPIVISFLIIPLLPQVTY